ncbi:MAG: phage major capsid protein [Chloroflexi bacterium]|nr:phage major capsid protein [Chloroflexota bacterium]
MPLTLQDAARLSQDMLVRGVVETIVEESSALRYLPFVQIVGNSLRYNQEVSLGDADFYGVGDTWTESAMTTAEKTARLSILGGDADVDAFLQQTYSDPNDLRALVVAAKAKALAQAFNDAFFNGDSAADALQFDGVKKLTAGARTFSKGPDGAVLALDQVDELVDMIKPGAPHALFMSKRSRRKLSSLRRASGSVLETSADAFGRRVLTYDGIPVELDDHILDTETKGANSDCSSIYAIQFGFQTGLCGLDNGGIQVQPLGALETKDAWRTRIKWYCGLALFRDIALARLEGVRI